MIDIKMVLNDPDKIVENLQKRNKSIDVNTLKSLLEQKNTELQVVEQLRAKMNENATKVKSASDEDRVTFIEEGKALKEEVKGLEEKLKEVEAGVKEELRKYPNFLDERVKSGKDDSENEELRTVGEKPTFSFTPKDHVDLGEALGIIDIERASKVSGSRFTYLKGDAVLLQMALVQFTVQTLAKEGFTPVLPPHIVHTSAMDAMGYLAHGGEDEIYHLKNDDSVLIGTSEQAMGPMHMDEILDAASMPLRYVAYSPCYRREAGSHGKDVRGILRVHQFDKIEMFSFTSQEQSKDEHEFLLSMQEKLMQSLKLPYQVMRLCSGDTGTPSAMTYDINTWIPSQNLYRETHSTSNTTDFQTRQLKIRYKNEDGKNVFAHALNGTAFAIGRIMIAILENYQQEDGSIIVPEVLTHWVGKDVIKK